MIRAYDEYGNVVDILELEKQIMEKAIDNFVKECDKKCGFYSGINKQLTRDIIDNQNANSRAVLDFLVNDKLATLQAENQNLKLAASQAAQNQYLVNELRPCAKPAYITCSPFQSAYGFGLNNSCGCC